MSNRSQEKRGDALRRFGGNRKTERAVADGLAWLAAHQRPDGIWDRRGFDQLCPQHDRCSQTALDHAGRSADVGVSALAALAFLGAGYTHGEGPYADNLSQVFSFILAQQDARGSFAAGSGFQMYNDAIATIAIAEALVLTNDPVLREPLERAVSHLARSQQDRGGWDYTDDTTTGRNDTSITSWVVMALKSAQAAGVSAPLKTRFQLVGHFDNAVEPSGRVWYADKRAGVKRSRGADVYQRRYGPAMIATGLFARSAFGFRLDDASAKAQIGLLLAEAPRLDALMAKNSNGLHGEYYWYYGTLALFNVGGEAWETWNAALRKTVLEYQERPVLRDGSRRHSYGSWPAFGRGWGKWGRTGGRIYSTAINTLTLEVYYRYLPAYLSPRGLIGPGDVRKQIAATNPADHDGLLGLALRLHPDTGEPVLLDLLRSRNADVSVRAALALADAGSPMGESVLRQHRRHGDAKTHRRIDEALKRIARPLPAQEYGAVTEINSQARMFLFNTGGQPLYYGQRVTVLRDGRDLATARVNRRFSADRAAAARVEAGNLSVRKGDVVVTLRKD